MQVETKWACSVQPVTIRGPPSEAWNSPIPAELLVAIEDNGVGFHEDILNLSVHSTEGATSWEERFGTGNPVADEVFMAWGFARYLGALADAGKAIKALPAYANALAGPAARSGSTRSVPRAVDRRRGWAASGVPRRQHSTSSRPTSTSRTARR